jgi:nicotinamidase-related amidase
MQSHPHPSTQSALLVIDVQRELFAKVNPVYQAEELLGNINLLVAAAHKAGVPVIYIQHNSNAFLVKDSDGWQLHPALKPAGQDLVIYKQHPNSFEKTTLKAELDQRQVGRLVITGMVTHGCVKATTLGALKLGYPVVLVQDGHSSPNEKAAELIVEWNDKLSQAGAQLTPAAGVTF